MGDKLRLSAAVLLIAGAMGTAAAQTPQQPPSAQPQTQPANPSERVTQSVVPGKIDGQEGNTAGRTPEDGQAIPLAPSDPNSADNAPGTQVPGASPQTMPSTLSAENAEKDAQWWLDRGRDLTPEQKQAIYRLLGNSGEKAGPGTKIFAESSAIVPTDATLHDVPLTLSAEIPFIKDFKFVVEQDKVVLVDPVNQVVAAVIDEPATQSGVGARPPAQQGGVTPPAAQPSTPPAEAPGSSETPAQPKR